MILRGVVLVGVLGLVAATAPLAARRVSAEDTKAAARSDQAKATAVDLSGRWAFNKELSDDAREKMREARENGGGMGGPGRRGPGMRGPGMGGRGMGGPGMGGGGRMGPPPDMERGEDPREAMRAVFEPAEQIDIYQGQPEIVLAEKQGRRRIVHADSRQYKSDNGSSEVKTAWKEGRLVIETRGFRGRKTTETWQLSEGGKRLTATVKLENSFGPGVTLKRVYDRLGAPGSGEAASPESGPAPAETKPAPENRPPQNAPTQP